jgi:hypothetical protein
MSITGEMPIGVLAVRPGKWAVRALTSAVNAEIEPAFNAGRRGESRASRLIRPYEPRRPRCTPGAHISHIQQRALL